MEFGGLRGLTFDTGQEKLIQDLQYHDQVMRQKQAMDAARAKMLVDDIEFQNGSNPFDAALIKQEGSQLVQKLGEMVAQRGRGWETDPDFLAQLKFEKSQLKNSPNVLRSVAYKQAIDQWNKDMAESLNNPTQYNQDKIAAFKQKQENYIKYGNPDGAEAAKMEGYKPLTYQSPNRVADVDTIQTKIAASLQPDEFNTLKNGRDGAYEGRVSDAALRKRAEGLYSTYKEDYDYLYKDEPDKIGKIMENMRPHIKYEYKIGDRNPINDALAIERGKLKLRQAFGGDGAPAQGSLYDTAVLNVDAQNYGPEILSGIFSATPPAFYIDADGKRVQVSKEDEFEYNGDITDIGYESKGQRNGVKRATGYILKPLDWAKTQGYVYDPAGLSGANDETDLEVKKSQKGKGEIIMYTTKAGKTVPMFKLNAEAVIDARNPLYKQRVDKGMYSKLREFAGIETQMQGGEQSQSRQPVSGTKQEFLQAGYSEEQIQRGVNEGLIQLQ